MGIALLCHPLLTFILFIIFIINDWLNHLLNCPRRQIFSVSLIVMLINLGYYQLRVFEVLFMKLRISNHDLDLQFSLNFIISPLYSIILLFRKVSVLSKYSFHFIFNLDSSSQSFKYSISIFFIIKNNISINR